MFGRSRLMAAEVSNLRRRAGTLRVKGTRLTPTLPFTRHAATSDVFKTNVVQLVSFNELLRSPDISLETTMPLIRSS